MNIQRNQVRIYGPDGNIVSANYPLSVDSDRVYKKDLDISQSDLDTFSGNPIESLFDNYFNEIQDVTATNPKKFKLVFIQPISCSSIGISTLTGDFSNVKLCFQTASGQVEYVLDDSTNNTKYKAWRYSIIPQTFDTLIIEFHTTDAVKISGLLIEKDRKTVSRLQAISAIDSTAENVSSYRGALNINNPWVNKKIVNETIHKHNGATTNPTTGFSVGDISGTVNSVAGFSIGDNIKFEETVDDLGVQEIGTMVITNIVGNVITWDRPIANDYTTATSVDKVDINMAVAGTLAAPVIFELHAPVGTIWQMTRLMFSITDGDVMDDEKFGGLSALTNGVALRATTEAGRTVVFANWKSNSDMKLDMFDVAYSDKAPAGLYGLNGRWTFTKAEVIAELNGDSVPLQKIEFLIQDDLTGLDTFTARLQGRVFKP